MEHAAAQAVVLVERQPLFLDALETIVRKVGIEVAERTTKLEQLLEIVDEHDPDLLVIGIEPTDDGLQDLLRSVQRGHPDLRIIVISDDDPECALAAFAAGADAYCSRTASADDLAAAIRQSFERSIYLPPPVRQRAEAAPANARESARLTRRELEILRLAASGASNLNIARVLWVTEQTVKFHLSNIYRKLDVANRTEASRWAQLHGLLDDVRSQSAAA
jgi:DNA-binding NarL/FixJ family response regulator